MCQESVQDLEYLIVWDDENARTWLVTDIAWLRGCIGHFSMRINIWERHNSN